MKLLVAGSRAYANQLIRVVSLLDDLVFENPAHLFWDKPDIEEVISGCASGPDHAAIVWAENHKISVKKMPADWKAKGITAGFARNEEMAKLCDYAIIIWDGKSRGTTHMMDMLNKYDKEFLLWEKLPVLRKKAPDTVLVGC